MSKKTIKTTAIDRLVTKIRLLEEKLEDIQLITNETLLITRYLNGFKAQIGNESGYGITPSNALSNLEATFIKLAEHKIYYKNQKKYKSLIKSNGKRSN